MLPGAREAEMDLPRTRSRAFFWATVRHFFVASSTISSPTASSKFNTKQNAHTASNAKQLQQ
jgi:hypothetical protein